MYLFYTFQDTQPDVYETNDLAEDDQQRELVSTLPGMWTVNHCSTIIHKKDISNSMLIEIKTIFDSIQSIPNPSLTLGVRH